MSDSVTSWTTTHQSPLSSTISWSLLKFMSIELVTPSNHLIHFCPLLLLPSIFPSIGVFPNELALHVRWPKYWSLIFSISPSNEYSELISFRIDWLDVFTVQGTVKSLLQCHSSKASILWCSTFFSPTLTSIYTVWVWEKPHIPRVWEIPYPWFLIHLLESNSHIHTYQGYGKNHTFD